MSKYIGVKVSNGQLKRLLREARWVFFHRVDEDGQAWVKVGFSYGASIMLSYGLKPTL